MLITNKAAKIQQLELVSFMESQNCGGWRRPQEIIESNQSTARGSAWYKTQLLLSYRLPDRAGILLSSVLLPTNKQPKHLVSTAVCIQSFILQSEVIFYYLARLKSAIPAGFTADII